MRAAALDRGCYPYPSPVVVKVGLDEEALRATFYLWELVSREKGQPYDEERLARYLGSRVSTWNILPVIAWEDDQPVGCVFMAVVEDPFTGEVTAFGDHAFVRRDWRGGGVFRQLAESAMAVAEMCGATVMSMPCGKESSYLRPFYEGMGFKEMGVIMGKKESR